MEIRLGNYRVVPYSQGTCWQLEKYGVAYKNGKVWPEKWRDTGHYPGTLHRAVEMLVEFAARDMDAGFVLKEKKDIGDMLLCVDDMVWNAVERIESAARNAS